MGRVGKVVSGGFSVALLVLVSCVPLTPREKVFESPQRQQQLRSLQSYHYDVTDRIRLMRAVIVTLQDLDFVINQADSELGFIGAARLNGYHLYVTIIVESSGAEQSVLRASLAAGVLTIPADAYREFFGSVQKNLALPLAGPVQ